jgi:hypothetical protein
MSSLLRLSPPHLLLLAKGPMMSPYTLTSDMPVLILADIHLDQRCLRLRNPSDYSMG